MAESGLEPRALCLGSSLLTHFLWRHPVTVMDKPTRALCAWPLVGALCLLLTLNLTQRMLSSQCTDKETKASGFTCCPASQQHTWGLQAGVWTPEAAPIACVDHVHVLPLFWKSTGFKSMDLLESP